MSQDSRIIKYFGNKFTFHILRYFYSSISKNMLIFQYIIVYILYSNSLLFMTTQISLQLQPVLSEIQRLLDETEQFFENNAIPLRSAYVIMLALDELVTNTISYAITEHGSLYIHVNIWCTGSLLIVEIIDNGLPFDPCKDAHSTQLTSLKEGHIGGLGTFLVRSFVDRIEYQRRTDQNYLKLMQPIN